MSEEKPTPEFSDTPDPSMKVAAAAPERRRGSRSAFAPIVLIAAGVFFLLENLGMIGDLDWSAAMRFWPLALIFLGLNILVVQLPRPWGTFMSLLVALAFVVTFGWLLVGGASAGALRSLGLPDAPEVRAEEFAITPGAAETAAVTLHLSNYPSRIDAGGGEELLAGTIWTRTGLDMKPSSDADDHIAVTVGELPGGFNFNPFDWAGSGNHEWEIYLSPDLPIDLEIDGSNGSTRAALDALALSGLSIDSSNGSFEASLPDGDYDVRLNGGNGSVALALADSGAGEWRVDGGNGSITLALPRGVAARVEYDTGNGSMNVDGRFTRVSGDRDEGVYETAGYSAGEGVVFVVETGNGSVTIED